MSTKPINTAMPKIILLVHDELTIRNYLFNLLIDKHGDLLLILQAENTVKAIELLKNFEVDFIISDFDLPDGSGLTIYSHLKKTKQFLPLIFFTETRDLHRYLPQMESFFKGVIKKPNFRGVLEIVGDWLANDTQELQLPN
jgi:DNA-binding NtrC family response regulator